MSFNAGALARHRAEKLEVLRSHIGMSKQGAGKSEDVTQPYVTRLAFIHFSLPPNPAVSHTLLADRC